MAHHFEDRRSQLRRGLTIGILAGISVGLALLACGFPPVSTELPEPISTDEGLHLAATPGTHSSAGSLPKGKLLSILPSGELGEEVRELALDSKGQLWVATHIGLGVWDGEQWKTYHAGNSPLPHDDVRAVVTAPDGKTVWIGTADGIARVDDEGWTVFTHENSDLSSPVINDLAFADDGTLWAATSFGGVAFYDGETWSYYDKYNSGLMGFSVRAFDIGPDGRMWLIDDFGDGVSVFDGGQWAYYTQENSDLFTYCLEQVVADGKGRAWFVFPGLHVLDGETWNALDFSSVYTKEVFSPRRLAEGPDGRLWLAGSRSFGWAPGELPEASVAVYSFVIDQSTISQVQRYTVPHVTFPVEEGKELPRGTFVAQGVPYPEAILFDGDAAWLGTSSGLFRLHADGRIEAVPLTALRPSFTFEGETLEVPIPTPPSGDPMVEVNDLALDAQGRLWVATDAGLAMWDREQWIAYNAADTPLPADYVGTIAVDPDGRNIWIGTPGGIVRFDGETWHVPPQFYREGTVAGLEFDREGRLWAGVWLSGVGYYDRELIYHPVSEPGSPESRVTDLIIGPDGRIWAAIREGGASVFDGEGWTRYTQENSDLTDNNVEKILADNKGRIWFIAGYKVSVLDGETWNPFDLTPFSQEEGFGLYNLAQSPGGETWIIGTHPDGIIIYSTTYPERPDGWIQEYLLPPIATEGTVASPKFRLSVSKGWVTPYPKALLPTNDGAWLGTTYGLFRLYDDGRIETIPWPNPLTPPTAHSWAVQIGDNPVTGFAQIYEFHPDHIRITAVGTISVTEDYVDESSIPLCDPHAGPDLYNPHDVTEFVVSENITICEGINLNNWFRPVDPNPAGGEFTYWMSEVVHRLPHLHTPYPIESGQEFHFGLRAPQPENDEHWVRILAFPLSAEITKVHGTPPSAEIIVGDWRLFIYDMRESNRPHANFILHDDAPPPPLEAYLEASGWQGESSAE